MSKDVCLMDIKIRLETEEDYRETEIATREAFRDLYKPGCDEHLLIHKIRHIPAFVRELDFVAVHDGKIVGNIVYSKAKVVDKGGREIEVLCLGPVCVLPPFQKNSIGGKLIRHSLQVARELGYTAVFLFGNPGYYHRFGFTAARNFHVKSSEGFDGDPFMALELCEGVLRGVEGAFYEDPVFKIDRAELELFEKEFPYKEKHVTSTQLRPE